MVERRFSFALKKQTDQRRKFISSEEGEEGKGLQSKVFSIARAEHEITKRTNELLQIKGK